MPYTRNDTRPLLTNAEYGLLFKASLADQIVEIDAAGLRRAIGRTRKLRDKAHDTHQQQAVEVRKCAGARGAALTANERTAEKEVALSEALGRFEKRLVQLEKADRRRGWAKGGVSRPSVPYLDLTRTTR